MTIGFFGDSFGDWDNNPDAVVNGTTLKQLSWPALVAMQTEQKCINTCQGGASLYYSYTQFLKYADQCETVVFLLTNPGRYTIPMNFEKALPNRAHLNGLGTVDHWLSRKEITPVEREKLNYLKGFYISSDFAWEHTACNLLVQEIKRIRPDVILIPCFDFYKEIIDGDPVSLQDIMNLQIKSLGCNLEIMDFISKYNETFVTCHYTPETSKLVANWIIDSIKNKKWTCKLPKHIEHANSLDFYYTKNNK